MPATQGDLKGLDVAIVHDYLNQRGGAERVVLELSDIWPAAPIYTSLYRPHSTLPQFRGRDVRASALDLLPVDRGFRGLLPLYPAAFRALGEIDADVVLSSSSGWAHMVRTSERALHVVYCYTPARWLYGRDHLRGSGRRSLPQAGAAPLLAGLRRTDQRAARRADIYIAISEGVRRRIKATYAIDAQTVHPPVDVDRFRPTARGERLLVVSRLLPYKHVDLIVRVATRLGVGLDVVGEGPELPRLRELAGPTVAFHGAADDETVVELMEGCRAVCVAAEEDFGLVAVEAQAAGKPVVAYGRGGALETIDDGLTGVLLQERSEESLAAALAACDELDASPELIAARAKRFSREAFRARLTSVLSGALKAQEQSVENRGGGLESSGRGQHVHEPGRHGIAAIVGEANEASVR